RKDSVRETSVPPDAKFLEGAAEGRAPASLVARPPRTGEGRRKDSTDLVLFGYLEDSVAQPTGALNSSCCDLVQPSAKGRRSQEERRGRVRPDIAVGLNAAPEFRQHGDSTKARDQLGEVLEQPGGFGPTLPFQSFAQSDIGVGHWCRPS